MKVHVNKLDKPDEMQKSPETQPTKTGSWRERNLNRPVTSKETESVIEALQQRKAPDRRATQVDSSKYLKKNSSKKLKRRKHFFILWGQNYPDAKAR